ncbi:MAG: hypothetical protein HND53_04480 [Proteobacteria bacterium]|nr:hypothetical protein [Pseudomonadota bacterium]NOG59734.1 hypothetical protein [Pseudomonadota bacterium]
MKKNKPLLNLFYVVGSLFLCTNIAVAAPKFPAPPDSMIGRPGDNMVVNGVSMDIRQFISRRSVEDVLQFYREFWPAGTEEKPGYTETDALEPWKIITRVENGYLMTVQVTEEGDRGSSGLLAISKMPDPENLPKLGKGFPKLSGSNVVNDISSRDIGKNGRTLQMMNKYSVERNAIFYLNHYQNQDWGVDMDQTISGGNTRSLRFSNGADNVSIVINKANNGSVVVVQSENH